MNLANKNASKRTAAGLERAAKIIGCGVNEINAVMAVESAKRGWDSHGRLTMLFEPHRFYRLLKKRRPGRLQQATEAGLAYEEWRPGAYPKDSYPRLMAAMAIDEELALQSASWGLPQIMGENHSAAGYDSAKEMVADFLLGEDQQIVAMARFVEANRLAGALRAHDWAAFARGYNGAGYRRNQYDVLLARAYEREKRRIVTNSAIKTGAVVSAGVGTAASTSNHVQGGKEADTMGFGAVGLIVAVFLFGLSKWRASRADESAEVAAAPEPIPAPPEPVAHLDDLAAALERRRLAREELKTAEEHLETIRSKVREKLAELASAIEAAN